MWDMRIPSANRTVRVRALLPPGARLARGTRMRVRIDDITAADRRSYPIAELTVMLSGADDAIVEVPVPVDLIDPAASYSAFVHIDVSDSGMVDLGDFLSPATHPVLTHGQPDVVDVPLIRVGGT
jgi:hypothetical protein